MPQVELRAVSKSYREGGRSRLVLDRVDARIDKGELVVLLGRSGSGKSTFLNLLSGIDLPDSGEVLLDGASLARMDERGRTMFRRRHVGFVFQFFNLVPTLTVLENLLLPLELNGRLDAAGRRRAEDLLRQVGLADRGPSFPDRLSGGEQQRVAVARALVHEPELILADEPTGNLDVETGIMIIELLDSLSRQEGRTLIMATHSLEVLGVADRILSIESGRLLERPPISASSPT